MVNTDTLPAVPPSRLPRLGQLLIDRGIASEADVAAALVRQRERGHRLGECLVELGHVDRQALYRFLAEQARVSFADVENLTIPPELAARMPADVARRFQALPIAEDEGGLVVAMADPDDVFELDDLAVIMHATIVPALADPQDLRSVIDRTYATGDIPESVKEAAADITDAAPDEGFDDADGSVVRLVDALLEQSISKGASDLHIEPSSREIRMRIRVDGVLRDLQSAPLKVLPALVTRVKVLANLDIANSRVPQDGRLSVAKNGRDVDVRVAVLPSSHGESIVLRFLDNATGVVALPALGFRPDELARYATAFHAPQGAVIISGPTGSGKTSTLYATLAELNTVARSIVSVEDPVEYELDGLKQIQINPLAGLTFASVLRSILRNDPNVIFVGEIRDGETAHIAGEASITGHLVFSTIHTTSAAAVPMRLIDMGVDPYLAASALTCVVAQRLARRLCHHCAVGDDRPDLDVLRRYGGDAISAGAMTIRRAVGCERCHGRGYAGRVAIYEIMLIDDEIRHLIHTRASAGDIERVAVAGGMDTLRVAGAKRVASGELTIDELRRVIA
jgi:type IV pilus assembly protein PilB